MKTLVSKSGAQRVVVEQGSGFVEIKVYSKVGKSKTLVVFDDLLPALIAQLSAVAVKKMARKETENELGKISKGVSQSVPNPLLTT